MDVRQGSVMKLLVFAFSIVVVQGGNIIFSKFIPKFLKLTRRSWRKKSTFESMIGVNCWNKYLSVNIRPKIKFCGSPNPTDPKKIPWTTQPFFPLKSWPWKIFDWYISPCSFPHRIHAFFYKKPFYKKLVLKMPNC